MSKNNLLKIITSILCLFAIVVGFFLGAYAFILTFKPLSDKYVSGELQFHFMQLGNKYIGDSIYIKSGETDILIDAGSRNDSATTIISYLDNYVEDNTLEYVIATHSDQDHISAFYSTNEREGVFDHYKVETIIDFPKTNKEDSITNLRTPLGRYCQARDKEVQEGAVHYTALECFKEQNGAKRKFKISNSVEMEILYNYFYENSAVDENDYSVCLMFNQGDNHYLFTGDLEGKGEEKMVDYYDQIGQPLPKCVLYKANHHGSKTSSTIKLLEKIKPEYVVVTCCAGTSQYTDDKPNQFPTQQFIDNIALYTDKVYIPTMVDNYVSRNDWSSLGSVKPMNGDIIFSVLYNNINLKFSNNNLKLKDTEWFKTERVCPESWKTINI